MDKSIIKVPINFKNRKENRDREEVCKQGEDNETFEFYYIQDPNFDCYQSYS